MGARLSVRLALAFSAVLAVGAGALFLFVAQQLSKRVWAESEATLRGEVLLLQDALGADIETTEASELQSRTQAFGKSLGIRITLIRADGTVLADSESNPQRMDNLASRQEVVAALSEEFGVCRRFSPTLGVDSLFVAKALRRGDRFTGWIRVSLTAERVSGGVRETQWNIIALMSLAALVAFLLGALWMQRQWPRASADS